MAKTSAALVAATASLIAVHLNAGCGTSALSAYQARLSDAPAQSEHAIHDERLRQLMGSIERLSPEQLYPAFDSDAERQRRIGSIVEVARALADSAASILEGADSLGLSPEDGLLFEKLADQLRGQAETLADSAPHLSNQELEAHIAEIDQTCDSCHQELRTGDSLRR